MEITNQPKTQTYGEYLNQEIATRERIIWRSLDYVNFSHPGYSDPTFACMAKHHEVEKRRIETIQSELIIFTQLRILNSSREVEDDPRKLSLVRELFDEDQDVRELPDKKHEEEKWLLALLLWWFDWLYYYTLDGAKCNKMLWYTDNKNMYLNTTDLGLYDPSLANSAMVVRFLNNTNIHRYKVIEV